MPEFTFGGAYALGATDSFVKLKSGPFAINPGPPLARVGSQDTGDAKPFQLVRHGRPVLMLKFTQIKAYTTRAVGPFIVTERGANCQRGAKILVGGKSHPGQRS